MRLFVTGLGGYLGRALAAAGGTDVTGTIHKRPAPPGTSAERVDVRDEAALARAVDAAEPDVLVHTAYIQSGPDARSVNVDGAAAAARVARARGVRLIHMSSDVVFAGDLGRPIREDDPPTPVTEYGQTKADAEQAVLAECPSALVVRTSMLYGGDEPSNHEQSALDPSLTFYEDEIRCPIVVGDLAAALIEAAAHEELTGPLHIAGAHAVTRLEFAQLVAKLNGRDPTTLKSGRRPLDRPGDLTLDCTLAQNLFETPLRGVREVM